MKIEKNKAKKGTRKLLSCTSNQYLQNLFDRTEKTFLLEHAYINIHTLVYNDFVIFEVGSVQIIFTEGEHSFYVVGSKSMLYPS